MKHTIALLALPLLALGTADWRSADYDSTGRRAHRLARAADMATARAGLEVIRRHEIAELPGYSDELLRKLQGKNNIVFRLGKDEQLTTTVNNGIETRYHPGGEAPWAPVDKLDWGRNHMAKFAARGAAARGAQRAQMLLADKMITRVLWPRMKAMGYRLPEGRRLRIDVGGFGGGVGQVPRKVVPPHQDQNFGQNVNENRPVEYLWFVYPQPGADRPDDYPVARIPRPVATQFCIIDPTWPVTASPEWKEEQNRWFEVTRNKQWDDPAITDTLRMLPSEDQQVDLGEINYGDSVLFDNSLVMHYRDGMGVADGEHLGTAGRSNTSASGTPYFQDSALQRTPLVRFLVIEEDA